MRNLIINNRSKLKISYIASHKFSKKIIKVIDLIGKLNIHYHLFNRKNNNKFYSIIHLNNKILTKISINLIKGNIKNIII
jgi:hypothetical protein